MFGSLSAKQRKGDLVGELRDHAELLGPTQSRKGADVVSVASVTWRSAAMLSRCAQVSTQWARRAPNDLEEGGNVLEDAQVL